MGDLAVLLRQLSPVRYERGRQFERLCQWYLRNDPVYSQQVETVWLWDEWPGRFGADAGIDLVAQTHDGDLWAVQAKAYDQRYSVTKADVDTFLSESGRPQFAFRLLIATTDLIGARAEKTLDEQAIPAGVMCLSQLEQAAVDWPDSFDDLRPRRPPRKRPLPHSSDAIEAVCSGFAQHDRGQLVMACGTGKTLVGLWVSERLACNRTLVLVPSLSLLAQTLREWACSATVPFMSLAVCSDPSVEQDDLVEHTAELGLPTTTDPDMIVAALSKPGRHVVFATYQSSKRVAEACARGAPGFDLAIADEAHRCAGTIDSAFTTIVEPSAISATRRLFMTATPRYFTARVKRAAEGMDLEVASMDDEEHFGPVFHRLSFGEAISRGLLADYQVAIVGVDDARCHEYVERARFVSAEGLGVTDARTLAGRIGFAKAMCDFDLRRVVSFHRRVSSARSFAQHLPSTVAWMPADERPSGALWAEHVSGAMPSGRRDTLLRRLREVRPGSRGVLSNARCLGEGVDVPAIDGVAFIDPRRSVIDITQAVGRAIRRSEEKVRGTVVLPVFVDVSSDPEQVLQSSVFSGVWEVLRALRAHDEVLAEQLDDLRRQLGRLEGRDLHLPEKLHVDLPVAVSEAFARAFRVRLIEQTTATWEQWFGMLQAYAERAGHARVPIDHAQDGWRLGHWVATQRRLERSGDLLHDRRVRLASVPGWSWAPTVDQWAEAVAALLSFVEREGHADVPKRHMEVDFNLGTWVQHQRTAYRNGTLELDRIEQLERLPGWVWNTKDRQWEQGFASLRRFVAANRHALVPDVYDDTGFPLGHWVRRQRQVYDRGQLNPSRRSRLESVEGWVWDVNAERWESAYRLLESFGEREGSARVSGDTVVDGFHLGAWVANQRVSYKKGRLAPGRVVRLEQIDDWTWDALDTAWEESFAALTRFVTRTGLANVPQHHVEDGIKLGWWCGTQRKAFTDGSLLPERVSRLEALPGWTWNPIEATWNEGFRRLEAYATREGQALVSVEFVDESGFRLGQWAAVQRRRRAIGKLDVDRVRRLDGLPGWSWHVVATRQQQAMSRLREFVAREGHAGVPVAHVEGGFPLGGWASERRKAYREGKLGADVISELERLPGWTWQPRLGPRPSLR